ncbi:low CO2 and stress-induced one-helix protein [Scenedesmus sp. NREL 46B-D3]|nr:low CO2 and stress-induced one-helix protein [Scenedesmus sp. NREL 46B-D3]
MQCLSRKQMSQTGLRQPAAVGKQRAVTVRAVDNSGLLKKPELKRPDSPPKKLFEDAAHSAAAQPAAAPNAAQAAADPSTTGQVTVEWQRQRAKEMRKYFQDKQLEKAVQKAQLFGWTPANEIGNGRWVMFGVFVGLLTEYATGVNFPDQIALLLSYLGIVDVE